MTLTLYIDVEQRSDEWYDLRRGIITASTIGQLITIKTLTPADNPDSRSLTTLLAAERITGWSEPGYISYDMQRGIDDEPLARNHYSERYTHVTECGFMIEDGWGFPIGYSPDGLIGDDGLIEIKSRRPKNQLATILDDAIPAGDMAQLQCALFVSGRDWLDYVSYCGGMPMFVKRVHPQDKWAAAIVGAAEACENAIAAMIDKYQRRTVGLPLTERTIEQEIVV